MLSSLESTQDAALVIGNTSKANIDELDLFQACARFFARYVNRYMNYRKVPGRIIDFEVLGRMVDLEMLGSSSHS